jgi:hypothetical protein
VEWRRFWARVVRAGDWVRQGLMVAVAIVVALVAIRLGAGAAAKAALANYLAATAVMIGGTTTIVFSVVIFLMQSTSDLHSSRYLDEYINARLRFIYFVIITIAMIFFGGSLYLFGAHAVSIVTGNAVVFVSLVIIAFVFALLDGQYGLIRRKINPYEMAAFIERKALRLLKQVESAARDIVRLTSVASQAIPESSAFAVAYQAWLKRGTATLDNDITLLLDMSIRLFERQEIEAAKDSVRRAGKILTTYISARKTSSVASPSAISFLAVESDSQHFLATHFEKMNRIGRQFAESGADDLAAEIVYAYRALADAAQDVTYIGLTGESPILEQVMQYLSAYMTDGSPPNVEVLFQGTTVLGEIGVMATKRNLGALLLGVQGNLLQSAALSLDIQSVLVPIEASNALLAIVEASFCDGRDSQIATETSLRGVGDIAVRVMLDVQSTRLSPNDGWSFLQRVITVGFRSLLNSIMTRYENITEAGGKGQYRRKLVAFFKELATSLRRIAQGGNAGSLLSGEIGRLIASINSVIIAMLGRDDFADVHGQLRDRLKWLSYTPYWFVAEGGNFEADDQSVVSLTEAVAQTGVNAWQALEDKALVSECMKSVDAIARKVLERAPMGSGYSEPRIFENALYLGVLALKSGWQDVLDELRQKMETFESLYSAKYGQVSRLRVEFERWQSEFDYERLNGAHDMIPGAQSLMYSLVDASEVAAFVAQMWPGAQWTN